MIQAHEIKVGNRFIRELRNSKGLEYDHDFILTEEWMGKLFGDNTSIALQDLFPIPLSKELLLAYGFTECKSPYSYEDAFVIGQDAGRIIWCANDLYKPISTERHYLRITSINGCQHLHELQNLIWCLFKIELNYQP